MSTPAQRATRLLEIHGGCCFVSKSEPELLEAFREMETAGLVSMADTASGDVKGFTIRANNFTPVINPEDDIPDDAGPWAGLYGRKDTPYDE